MAILGISVLVSNVVTVVPIHHESVLRGRLEEKKDSVDKVKEREKKKESVAPVLEEDRQ